MSSGELKYQVNGILDDLADFVNLMAQSNEKLEEILGGILLLQLTSSNSSGQGATILGNMAHTAIDSTLSYSFELRQKLTMYRDAL